MSHPLLKKQGAMKNLTPDPHNWLKTLEILSKKYTLLNAYFKYLLTSTNLRSNASATPL